MRLLLQDSQGPGESLSLKPADKLHDTTQLAQGNCGNDNDDEGVVTPLSTVIPHTPTPPSHHTYLHHHHTTHVDTHTTPPSHHTRGHTLHHHHTTHVDTHTTPPSHHTHYTTITPHTPTPPSHHTRGHTHYTMIRHFNMSVTYGDPEWG